MVATHKAYTSSKHEGFEFTFKPDEDSITITKTDTGYEVRYITVDPEPFSPRENDNLGTMVSFHPDYILGDPHKHSFQTKDYSDGKALEKALDAYMSFPLYLLDHSGLSISIGPSPCDPGGWDTSFLGFIYVTRETALKEYGKLGKKTRDTIRTVLLAEVEEYNSYLSGDVWGVVKETYSPEKTQIKEDSCWGFIGYKWAIEALKTEF